MFIRPVSKEDPCPRTVLNSDPRKQTKMRIYSHYNKPKSSCPTHNIISYKQEPQLSSAVKKLPVYVYTRKRTEILQATVALAFQHFLLSATQLLNFNNVLSKQV